jgi:hypothetical protein
LRFLPVISLIVIASLSLQCSHAMIDASAMSTYSPPGGYSYMKTDTIKGSEDGALSEYPVKYMVHRGSGVSKGQNVYLDGHSRCWPYDIRFTDADNMPLSYWIGSFDDNIATIWVKVDDIPASPDSTQINVYYGKTDDADESDGTAVFLFFDDFNDLPDYKWSTSASSGGAYSTTDSSLKLSSNTRYSSNASVTTQEAYPINNVAVGAKYRTYVTSRKYNGANFALSAAHIFIPVTKYTWNLETSSYTWADEDIDDCYKFFNNDTIVYQDDVVRPTAWSDWIESEVKVTGSKIYAYKGGSQVYCGDFPSFGDSRYVIKAEGCDPNNYGSQHVQVDYVYIRKHTPSEPEYGGWSEENGVTLMGKIRCAIDAFFRFLSP